jgi:hypothetical protein
MLPVYDFNYHEILVTTIGQDHDGKMFSHAGAFVRKEIAARNMHGKKVEVYYYDGNLNHACSIGGQTLASQPMDFEKVFRHCDVLKVYALNERTLCKNTAEDRENLLFEHLKLARNFLERPELAQHDHFVHLIQHETQKKIVKARVIKGKKEGHGRHKMTKAERTAKKNPKRAASAQLMPDDVIAAGIAERMADSSPRPTETFPSNIADDDSQME